MKFRIFTNDRDKVRGVPMYSAYCDVEAPDAGTAETKKHWPRNPGAAGAKAIEWPATTQSSKDWLAKHVG